MKNLIFGKRMYKGEFTSEVLEHIEGGTISQHSLEEGIVFKGRGKWKGLYVQSKN